MYVADNTRLFIDHQNRVFVGGKLMPAWEPRSNEEALCRHFHNELRRVMPADAQVWQPNVCITRNQNVLAVVHIPGAFVLRQSYPEVPGVYVSMEGNCAEVTFEPGYELPGLMVVSQMYHLIHQGRWLPFPALSLTERGDLTQ